MAHEFVTVGNRKFVVSTETSAIISCLKDIGVKLDSILRIVHIEEEISMPVAEDLKEKIKIKKK